MDGWREGGKEEGALYSLSIYQIQQGCKDIDDALHCTRLPNGNFGTCPSLPSSIPLPSTQPRLSSLPPSLAVGVHIAAVSYFVAPESALNEARPPSPPPSLYIHPPSFPPSLLPSLPP